MKVFEAIKLTESTLIALKNANVGTGDVEYIRLFEEFRNQQADGLKVSYSVAFLAEKYNISVRKVYDLIRKFRKKLRSELQLFMQGERQVEKYRDVGINWWDYCGSVLVNSYPTYFEKLPPLIAKINREKRNSKNYVLFLGSTDAESNQAPCLSLVQFQIDEGELVVSAYQRSSDANLGLPSDIYHLYLMARQIDLPLKSITLNLGNVHIYASNLERTRNLLNGDENVKFDLNV